MAFRLYFHLLLALCVLLQGANALALPLVLAQEPSQAAAAMPCHDAAEPDTGKAGCCDPDGNCLSACNPATAVGSTGARAAVPGATTPVSASRPSRTLAAHNDLPTRPPISA